MTLENLKDLFQVFGWPILSMIGVSWFLAQQVWPWFKARIDKLDERAERQNAAHISEMKSIREAIATMAASQAAQFTATMNELSHNRDMYLSGLDRVMAAMGVTDGLQGDDALRGKGGIAPRTTRREGSE